MKIIVAIPAYNEEKTIGGVIDGVRKVFQKQQINGEIVVADDGSTDKTAEIANSKNALVISNPVKLGLATTFRREMETCLEHGADIIVHIDADGQYQTSEIPKLIKEIENGYDLVLGSRFLGTIESMSFIKRIGNIIFSKVISNITKFKITDAQTGFRAFTKKIAEKITIISDHTYTQEQVIKVARRYKIKEVPIYFAKREGKSRLIKNPFEYAIKAWITIFRIYRDFKPLVFFGIIGAIPLMMGSVIGVWFTYNHFFMGGVKGHLLLSIFMMLLVLIGLQIILFGFLADMKK